MSLPAPVAPPARRLLVSAFGLAASRLDRQPWAAVHALAATAVRRGRRVLVATDVAEHGLDGRVPYTVTALPALFAGGRPTPALCALAADFAADELLHLCGLWELLRLRAVPPGVRFVPVLASPRLRPTEILPAVLAAGATERRLLALPLLNALLPSALLRLRLRRLGVTRIVHGSPTSRARLVRGGLPPGPLLPAPTAPAPPPAPPPAGEPEVVWFGPALAARGADLAVRIFEEARRRSFSGRLRLLVRPDDPHLTARLLARVRRSPEAGRITVETRRLPPAELHARLAAASAVLLPFRAPVAELPLVVFEAAARGRPVLVLDRPGIGDWGRALGLVVARRPRELATALLRPDRLPRPHPVPRADPLAALDDAAVAAFLRLRVFALCGPDGVGKTTLARLLADLYARHGLRAPLRWSRWRHRLSRPLCLLLRLLGRSRVVSHGAGRFRIRDARSPRGFARLFLWTSALDLALEALLLRLRRGPVVADRLILDSLVDLALETGLEKEAVALARPLLRLLPRPRRIRILLREPVAILRTRPDVTVDPFLFARHRLYREMARAAGVPVVAVTGTPEETLARLLAAEGGG